MLQNSKLSVVEPCKVGRNLLQEPYLLLRLRNNIFVRIWIFRSTSFKKQVSEADLRVVLSNFVPRYERIVSEKQQQKCH